MFHMIAQEMFRNKAVVGEISWPIPSEPGWQVSGWQVKSVGGSRFIDLGLAADRIAGPPRFYVLLPPSLHLPPFLFSFLRLFFFVSMFPSTFHVLQ